MEDRRTLKFVILLAIVCAILAAPVSGYNNVAAHPMINKYAVITFEKEIMPNDANLRTASLSGATAYGTDWNLADGRKNVPSQGLISVFRDKPLALWIIDGGFSADEPEYWQSLRHFYDPLNLQQPYLTDTKAAQWSGYAIYGAEMSNPGISALDWAFDRSNANLYSYPYAKMYFTKALLSDDRKNEYYGKAWRAVGETMHLVSDMIVPAHVRNDGHPVSEPYEDSVTGAVVEKIAKAGGSPANLNYNVAPRTLMDKVAGFTNTRFISADTVFYQYSLPDLSEDAADNGYIMTTINGNPYRVAKKSTLLEQMFEYPQPPPYPHLDLMVVQDQQKILIPTAIRASAAVLDRFLPRFAVTGDITVTEEKVYGEMVPVYYLIGKIDFIGNKEEWPDPLVIRNGASLVNAKSGKRLVIPVEMTVAKDNLNSFTYEFVPEMELGAEPGDTVFLEYDLGGYVVTSAEIVIPEVEKTPTPTQTATTTTTRYPSQGSIDSRCQLYSVYGLNNHPDICRYIYRQYHANPSKNDNSPLYSKEQYQICGCCEFSTLPAQICPDCGSGEISDLPNFISSACGSSGVTKVTTMPTTVPGGIDIISYCASTCGCYQTLERNCLNSGGGSSCNQYKTSYSSCISSCGSQLGNDGGQKTDTVQGFRARFPAPC